MSQFCISCRKENEEGANFYRGCDIKLDKQEKRTQLTRQVMYQIGRHKYFFH